MDSPCGNRPGMPLDRLDAPSERLADLLAPIRDPVLRPGLQGTGTQLARPIECGSDHLSANIDDSAGLEPCYDEDLCGSGSQLPLDVSLDSVLWFQCDVPPRYYFSLLC